MEVNAAAFYIISTVAIGFAVVAVTASILVRAALSLAFCFFTLAGVFWILGSPFVAVQQLVVNAGAIPIVTIFIVMMTRSRSEPMKKMTIPIIALAVAIPMLIAALSFIPSSIGQLSTTTPVTTERLGAELLSQRGAELELSTGSLSIQGGTILAFEATAVVLLVAFVGAIILARREGTSVRPESEEKEAVNADA